MTAHELLDFWVTEGIVTQATADALRPQATRIDEDFRALREGLDALSPEAKEILRRTPE